MGIESLVTTVAEDPGPFRIYLYGDWGCGKTVLACQAPKPLLIDTERSRRSLLNHPELVTTKCIPVRDWKTMEKVIFAIVDGDKYFDQFETIVIDTFTELQKRLTRDLVKEAHDKNDKRHPDLPSENEWNIVNTRLWKLLIEFIERTDKNLIITAHVREEKDDNGDTIVIRPGNTPGTVQNAAGLMDAVFYMSSETDNKGVTTRTLRTVANRKVKGKNRFGSLPAEIKNPTFDVILKATEDQRRIGLDLLEKERQAEQVNQEAPQEDNNGTETPKGVLNL